MNHTRGPWKPGDDYRSIVAEAPDLNPGDRDGYGGALIAESVSPCNVPLICAAPDLYEALGRLVEKHRSMHHDMTEERLANAVAALEKASCIPSDVKKQLLQDVHMFAMGALRTRMTSSEIQSLIDSGETTVEECVEEFRKAFASRFQPKRGPAQIGSDIQCRAK